MPAKRFKRSATQKPQPKKRTPSPNIQELVRRLMAQVSCGDIHHRDRKKAEARLKALQIEYDLKCVGIR
jgi:hypothetical protein